MDNYGAAEEFNKMYRESNSKGYQARYSKVNNGRKNKSNTTTKIVTGLVVGGIIGYYTYKNVIKPAASLLGKLGNIFNDYTDSNRNNSKVHFNNDRVFDGQVRRLSEQELRRMERDYQNTIYVPYEVINEKRE